MHMYNHTIDNKFYIYNILYNNNNIICKLITTVSFHLLIQHDLTCEGSQQNESQQQESQQQESQELF